MAGRLSRILLLIMQLARKSRYTFHSVHIGTRRTVSIDRRFRLPTVPNSLESHALRLANVVPIFQEEHKPSRLAHDVRVLNLMARL